MQRINASTCSNFLIGLKWFKIGQIGYNATNGQWGSDVLFINGGNATFIVPSCVASGQYLLRAEAIGKKSGYIFLMWMITKRLSYRSTAICNLVPRCSVLRKPYLLSHKRNLFNAFLQQMSCAQISVTGSSSPKTPATVSFPGAYTRKTLFI